MWQPLEAEARSSGTILNSPPLPWTLPVQPESLPPASIWPVLGLDVFTLAAGQQQGHGFLSLPIPAAQRQKLLAWPLLPWGTPSLSGSHVTPLKPLDTLWGRDGIPRSVLLPPKCNLRI